MNYLAIIVLFVTSNLLLPLFAMILFNVDDRGGFLKTFSAVWMGLWGLSLAIASVSAVVFGFFWSINVVFGVTG